MKHIDEYYKEWSGKHHTENSCIETHDSAECIDFAEFYHNAMISEPTTKEETSKENLNIPSVVLQSEQLCLCDTDKQYLTASIYCPKHDKTIDAS